MLAEALALLLQVTVLERPLISHYSVTWFRELCIFLRGLQKADIGPTYDQCMKGMLLEKSKTVAEDR